MTTLYVGLFAVTWFGSLLAVGWVLGGVLDRLLG
jgi:hypothetical protein